MRLSFGYSGLSGAGGKAYVGDKIRMNTAFVWEVGREGGGIAAGLRWCSCIIFSERFQISLFFARAQHRVKCGT